jgi:NADH-quinone oxidoreductase subunit E
MGEDHKLDREKEYSMDQEIKMGEKEKQAMLKDIRAKLEEFEKDRGQLVPILQMVQERHAYLDPTAIKLVADHLEIPTCEVYGVASFYNQFRFHPPGKHHIKVCLGTACHVRGGDIILENFERKLGIRDGETTPDREFSIERVACVGCCALAPVAIVDETVQGHMAPSKVEGLILGFQIQKEKDDREKQKSAASQ